jgi:hypothetical protein
VLLRKEGAEAGSRAIVFAIGGAVALASFALLGWDLWHHQTPYVPGAPPAPPSAWHRYFRFYWLFHSALTAWLSWRGRNAKASEGYWPRRNPFLAARGPDYLAAPEPDNAGLFRPHSSESANHDPRR